MLAMRRVLCAASRGFFCSSRPVTVTVTVTVTPSRASSRRHSRPSLPRRRTCTRRPRRARPPPRASVYPRHEPDRRRRRGNVRLHPRHARRGRIAVGAARVCARGRLGDLPGRGCAPRSDREASRLRPVLPVGDPDGHRPDREPWARLRGARAGARRQRRRPRGAHVATASGVHGGGRRRRALREPCAERVEPDSGSRGGCRT